MLSLCMRLIEDERDSNCEGAILNGSWRKAGGGVVSNNRSGIIGYKVHTNRVLNCCWEGCATAIARNGYSTCSARNTPN